VSEGHIAIFTPSARITPTVSFLEGYPGDAWRASAPVPASFDLGGFPTSVVNLLQPTTLAVLARGAAPCSARWRVSISPDVLRRSARNPEALLT